MAAELKVTALRGGKAEDITEAVKALYDLAVGSMDYGSGFWTAEDAEPVYYLAQFCGFDGADGLKKYIGEERHKKEAVAFQSSLHEANRWRNYRYISHEHSYSEAIGRCMWPMCGKERDSQ